LVHEKQTTPPSRYDQGALIKKLETSGIGRPATFASIIATLLERDYVRELAAGRGKQFLQPTEHGLAIDGLLSHAFPELVTERYTAEMEGKLDEIERGDATRPAYLRGWYAAFREAMGRAHARGAEYRAEHGLRSSAPRGGATNAAETTVRCDRCGEASYRKIPRKKGKGSFLACPACRMTRDVRAKVRPGACPKCGSALIEKKIGKMQPFWGCVRYGAETNPCTYSERGEQKPGRASSARASAAAPSAAPPAPPWTRQPTDKPCPKCGATTLAILTPTSPAAGVPVYVCEDRGCTFRLPVGAKRRREPCPACGGVVLERRSGDRPGAQAVWRCARHPECGYSAAWAGPS
ncbi:MAG TPA: DNA topoisomerase, partial [Gemmatimonadaceae bacterium]|nr:DNA topoisomerase [Gemmatimonadaceae bacterium]